uniref:Uncharacterized protein n=1 Tax=Anguilla anguilla TaxID=7936 RepID=A0A0E9W937_ANGAN
MHLNACSPGAEDNETRNGNNQVAQLKNKKLKLKKTTN